VASAEAAGSAADQSVKARGGLPEDSAEVLRGSIAGAQVKVASDRATRQAVLGLVDKEGQDLEVLDENEASTSTALVVVTESRRVELLFQEIARRRSIASRKGRAGGGVVTGLTKPTAESGSIAERSKRRGGG